MEHSEYDRLKAEIARTAKEFSESAVKLQQSRKELTELKIPPTPMEALDYSDRGDCYDVVVKASGIDKTGNLVVVYAEPSLVESLDLIVFSDVPPITLSIAKEKFDCSNLLGLKGLMDHIRGLFFRAIKEAPKEILDAYRKAFYKAVKEYNERLKNKPAEAGQVDDPVLETEEKARTLRDRILKAAQIKADQIIRDEQIRADQIRAKADVRYQTDEVDLHNVNLAAMLSVKGTFEESDIEKHISNRQALAEQKAKDLVASAIVNADYAVHCLKVIRAYEELPYTIHQRNSVLLLQLIEVRLGFKDKLSL